MGRLKFTKPSLHPGTYELSVPRRAEIFYFGFPVLTAVMRITGIALWALAATIAYGE